MCVGVYVEMGFDNNFPDNGPYSTSGLVLSQQFFTYNQDDRSRLNCLVVGERHSALVISLCVEGNEIPRYLALSLS